MIMIKSCHSGKELLSPAKYRYFRDNSDSVAFSFKCVNFIKLYIFFAFSVYFVVLIALFFETYISVKGTTA